MSQLHLSDEILMAFADGELEEPMAAAVAKAMAEDPIVAKRIMDFQQSRRLTRSAFASMPDVPPKLRAAVSAQIEAHEAADRMTAGQVRKPSWGDRIRAKGPLAQMALAASLAAVALVSGYFAGRQSKPGSDGLLAQLQNPLVHYELSTGASGKDVELPFGRLRIISTYSLANGSLCREFRLRSSSEAVEAVACRQGEWNATFALASPLDESGFTPSGGDDPMAAYLQQIGAGEPLVDEAEAKALSRKIP